jgi:peptidoglycan/LPS O-acetylase OafA/YrhL
VSAIDIAKPAPSRDGDSSAELQAARPWRHFVRHYAEMVVAMFAGMVVLGLALKPITGQFDVFQRMDVSTLVMATNMTIGMSLWMRFRRHSWASIAEMGAAMYLPFALLLVPYWAGSLSSGMLMVGGHVLMLAGMAAAMWRRRDEYLHGHTR